MAVFPRSSPLLSWIKFASSVVPYRQVWIFGCPSHVAKQKIIFSCCYWPCSKCKISGAPLSIGVESVDLNPKRFDKVSLKQFLSNSYDLHFASLPTLSSALSLLSQMSTTSLSLMLVNGSYCALYAVSFTISSRYEHHGKVEVCVNGKSLGLYWKL
ncbi:hypothetical protein ACFX1Q_034769 [Malus domestica]